MIRTNFHVTERQLAWLKKLSDESGLTVAELVRQAIDAFWEKKERDASRRQMMKAYKRIMDKKEASS